jgi:hypothetical protein
MKSLCDRKTDIFAKKCVGRSELELPISRLLDQTVTTRPLPLYKTDGQYTYIRWYWSHIYLPKSIWSRGRRCHGLTVARQARIHSANAFVGSLMMETRISFNARQHGKKQMILAQTLHCSTQTLYMASHKFVWQPVTQIFCVVFCAISVKSTQTFNKSHKFTKFLCDLGPHKACVVSSTQNHTRILRV